MTAGAALRSPSMSAAPRLPGLTLSDADWLVQAALDAGVEQGYPPLAVGAYVRHG